LKDRIKYWIDLSDYDMETAEAMLSTERFLYVGFMCHQAIEKILKAYFCLSSDEPPPFSHNLSYIAGKSGIDKILNDDFRNLLNILEPLNIEARYPTYKEMFLKSLTKAKCKEILIKTKELQLWVKERL
jgi:HEPN domain-containing protein